MDNCEKYHELISAYIDGITTEEETADLLIHVASCEDCSALLDAYTIVGSLFPEEEEAPEELSAGVLSQIHKMKAASGAGRRAKRVILSSLAAAACLTLAVVSAARLGLFPFDGGKSANASDSADMFSAFDTAGPSEAKSDSAALNSAADDPVDAAADKTASSYGSDDDAAFDVAPDPTLAGDEAVSPESSVTTGDAPAAQGSDASDTSAPSGKTSEEAESSEPAPSDAEDSDNTAVVWPSIAAEYYAAVYIPDTLPDIVSQRGFYTFGIDEGVLGIEIDRDTLSQVEAMGKWQVIYGDSEADWALIIHVTEEE